MLGVQNTRTHGAAQSRVLVLDTVLTQQAGVVPLSTGSCPTLDAYSAVLRTKRAYPKLFRPTTILIERLDTLFIKWKI